MRDGECILHTEPSDPPTIGLRPRDAARALGVSVRTLQKWRSSGTGPRFARFGASVVYPKALLEEWLAAQAGEGDAG